MATRIQMISTSMIMPVEVDREHLLAHHHRAQAAMDVQNEVVLPSEHHKRAQGRVVRIDSILFFREHASPRSIASATSVGGNNGGPHTTASPTGNRRQQYTLAELPFVCEFCQARYKTKPGLQYHLAKHKEANTDYRPTLSTPSTAESGGSVSSSSSTGVQSAMMKQKYMNPPMEHPQQHPMYSNHAMPGGPPMHNPAGRTPSNELETVFDIFLVFPRSFTPTWECSEYVNVSLPDESSTRTFLRNATTSTSPSSHAFINVDAVDCCCSLRLVPYPWCSVLFFSTTTAPATPNDASTAHDDATPAASIPAPPSRSTATSSTSPTTAAAQATLSSRWPQCGYHRWCSMWLLCWWWTRE